MGQNLIMNVADHGFKVIVFNRTVSKVDRFLENEAKGETANMHAQSRIAETLQE
jgi:6-phosphogluconate dehydrogenase